MQRIGIYGGSFDPVHTGHLILARDAVEQLGLARMIFVPAAISPHKLGRAPGAPGDARLAMLRAAVAGEPRFEVDPCELDRAGPSYSIDTVLALRARQPDADWHYLIGADNLRELHTWHRIDELRALVTFVVFHRRAPDAPAPGSAGLPTLGRVLDLSSTEIRNRVASGLSIRYLVPEGVGSLIEARALYRPPPAATAEGPVITAEEIVRECAFYAAEKKAVNIAALDLRGISTVTDYYLICSGTSEPHLKAIAGEIQDRLKEKFNTRPAAVDGFPVSQWVIIDYISVLVHIFHADKRVYYALEDLWSDAPRLNLENAAATA